MRNRISWTVKCEEGGKRETRVQVSPRSLRWQFKRSGDEAWDYDSDPTREDWDMLVDVLRRRAARGRDTVTLENVPRLRAEAGA